MEKILSAKNIVKSYGNKEVLHSISIDIKPGKIYGLLGRNGAGKTTLLSCITAQNTIDSGEVTYDGEKVWENEKVLGEICFSREITGTLMMGPNNFTIKEYLKTAAIYFPHWDKEYAKRLLELFELKKKQKICKLSKGMTSMVTIIIALASMAPITMLDEPVAGLDVVARELFYKLLLEDYTKTNRTFIISTHIIEEAVNALEEIILIDNGNIILKENTQELIAKYNCVSGKDEVVDKATKEFEVISSETVGRSKNVCVKAGFEELTKLKATYDIDITPVTLQKLFVYLTSKSKEESKC